jgi:hypothetical protein
MIRSASAVAAALVAASVSFSPPVFSEEETDQRFGTVHFDTSCNDIAQRRFDRAMRYQHSFWYRESRELFEEVLKADPDCGIAYWGIALSLLNNPHAPPPVGNLRLGFEAVEKAKAVSAKTQRERDFINAMAAFYTDFDKVDHRSRVLAYLKAMEGMAQAYPNDDERRSYAIELCVAARQRAYAMQLKAAILSRSSSASLGIRCRALFDPSLRHPGPGKKASGRRRYSQVHQRRHVRCTYHHLHPSGYWKERSSSNFRISAGCQPAAKPTTNCAMDYLVYTCLPSDGAGQSRGDHRGDARGQRLSRRLCGPYALAVSPARSDERGD